jgi:penicillin-binding protein 1A
VDTTNGTEGTDRVIRKEAVSPAVAETATSILSTVVSSGTGKNAATEEPTWGKTGTTDDNGDAWFVGATDEITVAVWVGHPDAVTPMTTEFGGAPVDGGTFPALIFHDVVLAYEELQAQEKAEDAADEPVDDTYVAPVDETYVAPPVETAPVEPVVPEEAAPPEEAPPADPAAGDEGGVEGKREQLARGRAQRKGRDR